MKKAKINLGSGNDYKGGWINVDVDSSTNPDIKADLLDTLPFKNNYAEEILLQDVLEHFIKEQGTDLLKEIHRIMKVSGKLTLRIPNVFQIIDQFKHDPMVMMEFLYGTTKHNGIWGAHKYGYEKKFIKKQLKYLGFDKISINKETTNYIITCYKSASSYKMPNILILQQSPDWGGAEEWMLSLVKYFHKANISTHVATNYKIFNDKVLKISSSTTKIPFTLDIIGNYKGLIKSILLFPFAVIWYLSLLIKYKRIGVNCILMSGFSEKLLVTVLASLLEIHIVWLEYGPLENVFKKNLYLPKVLYRLTKDIPESVITISENTKQALIKDAKISLTKLKVIYPGTQVPHKKPKFHQTDQVVGHLSRLSEEKGQRLLLRSWKFVLKSLPKAKLIIAGKGPDMEYLVSLSKKLKIDRSVEFVGFIKNKKEFYKKLSLFVFPSIWKMEGFGIVIIEALSYGIPVVAIDNGPAKEIIHSDIGRLSQKSPRKLADQIIGIIKAKQLNTQSVSAHNEVKEKYNLDTQAQKVLDEITYAIS